MSFWKAKFIKWLKRYGPAEIIGTIGAYFGYFITYKITDNKVITAYGAAMGENLGFYSTIFISELKKDYAIAKLDHGKYKLKDLVRTIANLFIDFGLAEALDSLLIRPSAIGFGTHIFGRKSGILIGKIAADIIFYIPAIISYEFRESFRKSRDEKK